MIDTLIWPIETVLRRSLSWCHNISPEKNNSEKYNLEKCKLGNTVWKNGVPRRGLKIFLMLKRHRLFPSKGGNFKNIYRVQSCQKSILVKSLFSKLYLLDAQTLQALPFQMLLASTFSFVSKLKLLSNYISNFPNDWEKLKHILVIIPSKNHSPRSHKEY